MDNETSVAEKKGLSRLFIPSVVLPYFTTFMANGIIMLILFDITAEFFGSATPSTLGIVGQLSTFNSAAEAVFSLLMGFLAIRFRHRPLFLTGVLLIAISSIGNFLAPSFLIMQIFFIIEGIGSVLISITGLSLLGDFLPAEKRHKAVSYTLAATFLSVTVGSPIVGFITSLSGWRFSFLLYSFPIAIIGLLIAYFGIPKSNKKIVTKQDYIENFKKVLLNKSALACLISQLMFLGSVVGMYVIAFYQYQFQMQTSVSSIILVACALLIVIGSVVAGRIVTRFGIKRTTILCFILDGITLAATFQMTDLWAALILNFIHVFFFGIAVTSFNCLALDQIPQSRSTMMSMTSLFGKIGNTTAAAISGFVLFAFSSFPISGLVFGVMTFTIVAILLFTKEPNTAC